MPCRESGRDPGPAADVDDDVGRTELHELSGEPRITVATHGHAGGTEQSLQAGESWLVAMVVRDGGDVSCVSHDIEVDT
jgi:hypothetical protein